MKPLLFIHGTGTRRASYDKTLAEVKKQVGLHLSEYSVREGYWGEPHGSKQWVASIPTGPTQKDLDEAREIALWRDLLEDPFFELRLLESLPKDSDEYFDTSEGRKVWSLLEDLDLPEDAKQILENNELAPFWVIALENILTEPEDGGTNPRWRDVVENSRNPSDARTAISHCLIAQTIQAAYKLFIPPMGAYDRSSLHRFVIDELGGVPLGIGSFLAKVLLGSALLVANPAIRADRGDLTTDAGPAAGDTLLYQARGEGIRGYIEQRILDESNKDGPVLIVAHSLGGIASLDLLIKKQELWPHVRALVTVGSQASYMCEIGALWSLPNPSAIPSHFPQNRWLNVLNRWDFLSYPAQKVFPDHAHDFEVSALSPFPLSHGAYWKKGEMWKEIRRFIHAH